MSSSGAVRLSVRRLTFLASATGSSVFYERHVCSLALNERRGIARRWRGRGRAGTTSSCLGEPRLVSHGVMQIRSREPARRSFQAELPPASAAARSSIPLFGALLHSSERPHTTHCLGRSRVQGHPRKSSCRSAAPALSFVGPIDIRSSIFLDRFFEHPAGTSATHGKTLELRRQLAFQRRLTARLAKFAFCIS